jgi:hypothetical protein
MLSSKLAVSSAGFVHPSIGRIAAGRGSPAVVQNPMPAAEIALSPFIPRSGMSIGTGDRGEHSETHASPRRFGRALIFSCRRLKLVAIEAGPSARPQRS